MVRSCAVLYGVTMPTVMPNSTPSLYGLQKAAHIGPDPTGEAITAMKTHQMQAALPNPENRGSTAIDGLLKLAQDYHGPVQETLGEIDPFHTPVGGEGLYNVGRGAVRKASDMAESAYSNIMAKMGR